MGSRFWFALILQSFHSSSLVILNCIRQSTSGHVWCLLLAASSKRTEPSATIISLMFHSLHACFGSFRISQQGESANVVPHLSFELSIWILDKTWNKFVISPPPPSAGKIMESFLHQIVGHRVQQLDDIPRPIRFAKLLRPFLLHFR